jgi:hypothetical protein
MAARTTTPKTETETAPEPGSAVEEYDFDSWSQEKEDAELRALNDVQYIIVEGGTFVGRFSDLTIVKIPLKLSMSMIDELEEKFTDPLDQFKHLLGIFAGEEVAEDLKDRNMISVAIMTRKYFTAFKRAQDLAFPEA